MLIWSYVMVSEIQANVPISYPLKVSEKLRVSDVFRGYRRKARLAWYGLTIEAPTPQNGQTICQQQPKNCLSVFDYFVGLELKRSRNFWWHFAMHYKCKYYMVLHIIIVKISFIIAYHRITMVFFCLFIYCLVYLKFAEEISG